MSDSSADRNPLDRLAEEFVGRLRAGKRPSLTEYIQRNPELEEPIRELFPALVEMEQLKPVTADDAGAPATLIEPTDPVRVGEFRILRRVGRGGMGVVYEAVQESLGRHVALKLLPPEAVADPKRLERFRREASAAARLHHTNIVPVFGVGVADGRHFYAMQFISGHPLDDVIDEVRRLKTHAGQSATIAREVSEVAAALLSGTFTRTAPPGEPNHGAHDNTTRTHHGEAAPSTSKNPAPTDSSPQLSGSISEGGRNYWSTVARIGAQVADALAYAHGQGVLHRDIKPANLLLDLRGTVWLTDFGLAKAADAAGADDLTRAGDVVGTLRYMAPERFDGTGDHRADIYSLGLTLYELLTLEPAFTARGRAQLVEQALAAAPPSPRSRVPAIPRDLETIVLKAIARDPAMRYASAGELAEDLRRFQEDRTIRARRASSAEQAFRWCRRNPAVASLLTAVLVVFAAGAGISLFFASQAKHRELEARAARDRADAESVNLRKEQDYTRVLLYISQMNHASVALAEGRIERAAAILDETAPKPGEPDLRDWEWHYLDRLLRGGSKVVQLEAPIDSSAVWDRVPTFSADRQHVVRKRMPSGPGGDALWDVWDAATGARLSRVPLALPAVAAPTVSPDGRWAGTWEPLHDDPTAISMIWPGTIAWKQIRSFVGSVDMPSHYRLRIVDLATGTSRSGPEVNELQPWNSPTRVYFDAGGVRWLERAGGSLRTKSNRPRGGSKALGPAPDFIARRWDMATGAISSDTFRPGPVDAAFQLYETGSADGRIWVFYKNNDFYGPGSRFTGSRSGRDGPDFPEECWDVGASPPRRLWSMPEGDGLCAVSPSGKFVARVRGLVVTLYRVEEQAKGPAVEWEAELSPVGPAGPRGLTAVTDDGRVLLSQTGVATVLWPTTEYQGFGAPVGVTVRQAVVYSTDWISFTHRLTINGSALMSFGEDGTFRRWEIDTQPAQPYPQFADISPDGRWKIQTGGDAVLEVKDAATGEVRHRLTPPVRPGMVAKGFRPVASDMFVASSRRYLARFIYRNADPRGKPSQDWTGRTVWILYDTADWRPITFGEGDRATSGVSDGITESPAGRWLVDGRPGIGDLYIRDSLTGRITCELKLPSGTIVGGIQFDPTEDRLLVAVVPALSLERPSFGPKRQSKAPTQSGSLSVRLLDPATGAVLWSAEDVGKCVRDPSRSGPPRRDAPLARMAFAGGNRVVVQYTGPDGNCRAWVGRADDGTTERTLVVPMGGRLVGRGSGPGIATIERMTIDRDGRRITLIGDGEVRVFDLESGDAIAAIRGQEQPVMAARLSPDGRRLFTADMIYAGDNRQAPRIAVWDVPTGRRVFTLQPPERIPLRLVDFRRHEVPGAPERFELQNRVLKISHKSEPYTFDGTPIEQ